ncbi:MAG TPA: FKBP-type peptidyl-prolyl cis-trans isomerase [Vibrio sp.]|uniref:FKBP-type peptidyl-prolyl cis-trans isomerase n=1 Tax=Vibrio TaxID=662 RepID=UPI0003FCAE82|nr:MULTISPECIES: FKBP-type peptidyl-prolyl cis-trans isomerase [Vibrio]HCH00374.1 FKBP-type peptidyl-prolyl cis-trans isomerase [Vibrio sp.]
MKIILPIIILLFVAFFIYRNINNQKLSAVNIEQGEQFLTENSQREGVIQTDSGLQYLVLKEGNGSVHPTATSQVKVHYQGTLLDGTEFDSSYKRGEPISFKLNQVIKGWQEGLQLMVEGEKVRLFIPYDIAYGKSGSGPIPAGATLIFDVELIEILD